MRYPDGNEVRRGDRVRIFDVDVGVVVFSIDAGEFSAEFPERDWAYLKAGVMVRTKKGALVHIDSSQASGIVRVPDSA